MSRVSVYLLSGLSERNNDNPIESSVNDRIRFKFIVLYSPIDFLRSKEPIGLNPYIRTISRGFSITGAVNASSRGDRPNCSSNTNMTSRPKSAEFLRQA